MILPGDRCATQLLVTVKAYPNPSTTYGETVCVAGITVDDPEGPRWNRLYPIQFRDLETVRQFKKWDVISVSTTPTRNDQRPESRRPMPDTIEVVRHIGNDRAGWAERRRFVEPVAAGSMCEVQRRQREDRTSLAAIRPLEIRDLRVVLNDRVIAPERRIAAGRLTLMKPNKSPLEVIPYRFIFDYRCADPRCPGHNQSIIDWEVGQFFRRERANGATVRAAGDRTRERWLSKVCADSREQLFFVGNLHKYPKTFQVLGVFWPPRAQPKEQLPLF